MSRGTLPWSAADDDYVRQHYPAMPTSDIVAHLQRPARHIRQRAYELGVKKVPGAKQLRTGKWTQLDDLLQLLYADMRNEDLSELLGQPAADIASRACHLGLHKSPEVLAQTYSLAMLRSGPRPGQFEPGTRPWNKDLRGYSVELGRSHFKAGNRPPTWVPVGTERWTTPPTRSPNAPRYLKRKVAEPDQWALVHHIVWEQHHGPVPDGFIVTFVDGDTSNPTIDNLRCICRADLSASNGSGMPVDLLPAWRLARQLQQEINALENPTHERRDPAPSSSQHRITARRADAIHP